MSGSTEAVFARLPALAGGAPSIRVRRMTLHLDNHRPPGEGLDDRRRHLRVR